MILAIDPGNIQSAYVVLDESNNLKPIIFGKVKNEDLLNNMKSIIDKCNITHVAIEMIASYGMAVGVTTFDTVFWIGRFYEIAYQANVPCIERIYRKDEKINLCGTMKAKDANTRQALIDRFGVIGTKKNPGWFYGISADMWQAIAVGVTYYDMYIGGTYEPTTT